MIIFHLSSTDSKDMAVHIAHKAMTSNEYHKKKKQLCENKNIDLIFIWEHDWKNNKEVVKDNIIKWLKNEQYYFELFNKFDSILDKPELYKI